MRTLLPEGWPRPKGYANGIECSGRLVFVAGQVGWNTQMRFEAQDFSGQFRQALLNTLAVLNEAAAGSQHIVRMTWFITDRQEYLEAQDRLGATWKELMGRHYPAMSVVIVNGLVEREAKLEIETTAVVPHPESAR